MALCIDLDHRQGNPQADFVIDLNLNMVGAVFLKLHAAKEMDIGGVGVEIGERERNLRLGNGLVFLGIVDEAFLDEVTTATTPACPEAEFEKTNRKVGGRDCPENADQGLLAADFRPHILAENGSLKIGKDKIVAHEVPIVPQPSGIGNLEIIPNFEADQSDLTQSPDRVGVLSILACIKGYALESPQLLSASTLRQLITVSFEVRDD